MITALYEGSPDIDMGLVANITEIIMRKHVAEGSPCGTSAQ